MSEIKKEEEEEEEKEEKTLERRRKKPKKGETVKIEGDDEGTSDIKILHEKFKRITERFDKIIKENDDFIRSLYTTDSIKGQIMIIEDMIKEIQHKFDISSYSFSPTIRDDLSELNEKITEFNQLIILRILPVEQIKNEWFHLIQNYVDQYFINQSVYNEFISDKNSKVFQKFNDFQRKLIGFIFSNEILLKIKQAGTIKDIEKVKVNTEFLKWTEEKFRIEINNLKKMENELQQEKQKYDDQKRSKDAERDKLLALLRVLKLEIEDGIIPGESPLLDALKKTANTKINYLGNKNGDLSQINTELYNIYTIADYVLHIKETEKLLKEIEKAKQEYEKTGVSKDIKKWISNVDTYYNFLYDILKDINGVKTDKKEEWINKLNKLSDELKNYIKKEKGNEEKAFNIVIDKFKLYAIDLNNFIITTIEEISKDIDNIGKSNKLGDYTFNIPIMDEYYEETKEAIDIFLQGKKIDILKIEIKKTYIINFKENFIAQVKIIEDNKEILMNLYKYKITNKERLESLEKNINFLIEIWESIKKINYKNIISKENDKKVLSIQQFRDIKKQGENTLFYTTNISLFNELLKLEENDIKSMQEILEFTKPFEKLITEEGVITVRQNLCTIVDCKKMDDEKKNAKRIIKTTSDAYDIVSKLQNVYDKWTKPVSAETLEWEKSNDTEILNIKSNMKRFAVK